ncbi:response regulator receiver and PAS/PAC sensor-containing signal transduction histidine kinase/phosphotransferase [Oleiphilus messinensis]|uniref:Sensory/regulatory protein RpfC n=2 Tax=Oleiphilus messinensis TaxID=141451 RepID=A0A1Y0IBS8_9GAMM|nr:response regulator receiver and PAS/PAC sensor-containing signal transduction histidine kinase/phosphotransferase [Oleiphilus messinensis]
MERSLLVGLGLILILLLVLWGHAYYKTVQEYDNQIHAELNDRLAILESSLDGLKRDIFFLSTVPPIQGIQRAVQGHGYDSEGKSTLVQWKSRLQEIFRNYIQAHPNVFQVRYIGVESKGRELVRVERRGGSILAIAEANLQEKGQRPYFQSAINLNQEEVYISEVNLNRELGAVEVPHKPTIRIATPIYNVEGQVVGVVVINYLASDLLLSLSADLPERWQFYLLNSAGDFLVHPNRPGFAFEVKKPERWEDEFFLGDSVFRSPLINVTTLNNDRFWMGIEQWVIPPGYPRRTLTLSIVVPSDVPIWSSLLTFLNNALVLLVIFTISYLFQKNVRQAQSSRVEQARLAAIVQSSTDAILGLDAAGKIAQWNPRAEELLDIQYIIKKGVSHLFIDENSQAAFANGIAQAKDGTPVADMRCELRNREQVSAAVVLSINPIFDSSSTLVGLAITIRDISQQLSAERQVRELNCSLEQQVEARTHELRQVSTLQAAILNSAGMAIIATDSQGTITLFNPTAEKMLGYEAAELLHKKTPALFHLEAEVAARAQEFSRELGVPLSPGFEVFVIKTKMDRENTHEWSYVRKDGSVFQVNLTVTALKDQQRRVVGYLGVALDISSQVLDRRNLTSVRDHLLKAAEVAQLGIWSWNLETDELIWNEQMLLIYQVPSEVRKTRLYYNYWLQRVHPEDVDKTVEKLNQALAGTGNYDPVFRISRPNGEIRYVKAAAVVERNEQGDPVMVLGINQDITEQRQYEAELKQARELADKANRSKSEFLANMSHEIRTPMNAVIGMLQLAERTRLDPQQADYIKKAGSAARSLLSIINDILDFSKIEAGKLTLDPQANELDEILRDISVIVSSNIGNKDIEVLFDIQNVVPAWVRLDGMRLKQVLINLTGNAVKFTEEGEVIIGVKLVSRNADDVVLQFEVRDTGIGIAEDKLARIFEGFAQAEASTARQFGGTGLGLAISKRLVEMMGGKITVESELHRGSTFMFTLPCVAVDGPDHRAPVSVPVDIRALIVDDNSAAREIMSSIVESFGWSFEAAESGEQALQILVEAAGDDESFDIVLMDWSMPGLDGWETSEAIRNQVPAARLPMIVMVTAHGREAMEHRNQNLPNVIDDFLVKPLTASMVLDSVADALVFKNKTRGEGKSGNHHGNTESLESHTELVTDLPIRAAADCRLQSVRILLVEDNLTNQQVASELLQSEGASVDVAVDGAVAVEKLRGPDAEYDLVLMDVQMPGMDGYTATRHIRNELKLNALPIVAMTANALPSDRKAALDSGMNDHIGKPFDLDQLVAVIGYYVELGGPTVNQEMPKNEVADPEGDYQLLSVLNKSGALGRMAGNERIYQRAVVAFLKEVERIRDGLEQQAAMEREQAEIIVHSLKGMSAAIGGERVSAIALSLEEKLKTMPLDAAELTTLKQTLLDELAVLCDLLQAPLAADSSHQEMS